MHLAHLVLLAGVFGIATPGAAADPVTGPVVFGVVRYDNHSQLLEPAQITIWNFPEMSQAWHAETELDGSFQRELKGAVQPVRVLIHVSLTTRDELSDIRTVDRDRKDLGFLVATHNPYHPAELGEMTAKLVEDLDQLEGPGYLKNLSVPDRNVKLRAAHDRLLRMRLSINETRAHDPTASILEESYAAQGLEGLDVQLAQRAESLLDRMQAELPEQYRAPTFGLVKTFREHPRALISTGALSYTTKLRAQSRAEGQQWIDFYDTVAGFRRLDMDVQAETRVQNWAAVFHNDVVAGKVSVLRTTIHTLETLESDDHGTSIEEMASYVRNATRFGAFTSRFDQMDDVMLNTIEVRVRPLLKEER